MNESEIQEPILKPHGNFLDMIFSHHTSEEWFKERCDIIEKILTKLGLEYELLDREPYYNYTFIYNNQNYSFNFHPYIVNSHDGEGFAELCLKKQHPDYDDIYTFWTATEFYTKLIEVLEADQE